MLDPKELRAGNILKLSTGAGQLLKADWKVIKQISEEYQNGSITANRSKYLPVEIDGEILFQLGFEWDTDSPFIFTKGKILLKRRRNGFFFMISNSKPYHKRPAIYLHQLQNLHYFLFDEELGL